MNFECYSYISYIYTRKHHKEDRLVKGHIPRESPVRVSISRDSLVRRSSLNGKLPFPFMSKGERFIRCMKRENKGMTQGRVMVTGGA
jgi:hypothetical protein